MNSFKMKIASDTTEEDFDVHIEDIEYELLKEFHYEVKRMLSLEVFRKELNVSWHIEGEVGQNTIIETNIPPQEDVMIILHSIRPFILQKERLYLIKIINILCKSIKNSNIRKIIEYNRKLFNGVNSQSILKVKANDILINSEMFLIKYLNAYEYHRDKDKKEFLNKLFQSFPEQIGRFFVVSLVFDKVQAIKNIEKVVGLIIGNIKSLEFKM